MKVINGLLKKGLGSPHRQSEMECLHRLFLTTNPGTQYEKSQRCRERLSQCILSALAVTPFPRVNPTKNNGSSSESRRRTKASLRFCIENFCVLQEISSNFTTMPAQRTSVVSKPQNYHRSSESARLQDSFEHSLEKRYKNESFRLGAAKSASLTSSTKRNEFSLRDISPE